MNACCENVWPVWCSRNNASAIKKEHKKKGIFGWSIVIKDCKNLTILKRKNYLVVNIFELEELSFMKN